MGDMIKLTGLWKNKSKSGVEYLSAIVEVDKFIAAMRPHLGENNLRRDGSKVIMIYDKCLCPLVNDIEGTLPGEYCLCTRGWTKAVYGALAGKEVKVDLKSSIKRGDPQCLIEVDLD